MKARLIRIESLIMTRRRTGGQMHDFCHQPNFSDYFLTGSRLTFVVAQIRLTDNKNLKHGSGFLRGRGPDT